MWALGAVAVGLLAIVLVEEAQHGSTDGRAVHADEGASRPGATAEVPAAGGERVPAP